MSDDDQQAFNRMGPHRIAGRQVDELIGLARAFVRVREHFASRRRVLAELARRITLTDRPRIDDNGPCLERVPTLGSYSALF
jgi:hypothetical protein